MSRIIMMHKVGGPDVLQLQERPTPLPGAGMITIRVHAVGLNRSDTMVRTGAYPLHPLPASLGFEAAGIVEHLGQGAGGVALGDRVAVLPDASAGYTTYGEHCVVPAHLVVPIMPEMSFQAAAALWGTVLTAYNALISFANLTARDHVLISGASSGVGIAAIQIARQVGAVPIALTRDQHKADRLREAGAAHVGTPDDIAAVVREVTDGKGARVVFDTVGGAPLARLTESAAVGGVVLLNGALGGNAAVLPLSDVMIRRLTLRGLVLAELMEDRAVLDKALRFVEQGLAQGVLRPVIAAIFPLERIADAHRFLESNAQVGKVVVSID